MDKPNYLRISAQSRNRIGVHPCSSAADYLCAVLNQFHMTKYWPLMNANKRGFGTQILNTTVQPIGGHRCARAVLLLLVTLLAACSGGTPGPPGLTPEAKAYVKNLKLSDVEMKAAENYMGSQLVEITGKIANEGDHPLQQVDLNCVFYDAYNQVVLRQRVSIVRTKTGGLKPGETKSFRLPFDTIPQSWNQSMPQMVIAGVLF
jgi:hypothetical protein